jgi:hypothetical protein
MPLRLPVDFDGGVGRGLCRLDLAPSGVPADLPACDARKQCTAVVRKSAAAPGDMLIRANERQVALVQLAAFRHLNLQRPQRDSPRSGCIFHDLGAVIAMEMKETESRPKMIEKRAAIAKK